MDHLEDLLVDVEPLPATADNAEEELEWLSNKDAFPSIDASSIDFQSPSRPPPRLFPGKPRSQGRRRRRRVFLGFGTVEKKTERRKCKHCEAEDTPQWRAGPEGPKTLCNACGVRFKSGRLVPEYRPALSPSFSPGIHSNSHRRILEMRRRHHRSNAAVS